MACLGGRNMTALMYALDFAHGTAQYKATFVDMSFKLVANSTEQSLNVQSVGGYTALMMAIRLKHPELVNRIIQKRANVNINDPDGSTLLMKVLEMINCEYCFYSCACCRVGQTTPRCNKCITLVTARQ